MDRYPTSENAPAGQPGRSAAFECLRAVACLFIVLLHTTDATSQMYPMLVNMSFWQAAGTRAAINELYWAVPCFIMVTGALLLQPSRQIGYKKLFSKYIARVLKAIVVFGVLFAVLEAIFNPSMRTWSVFLGGVAEVFTGNTWAHMWYLYCLVGLYLLLPLYKAFTATAVERDVRYLLIVYGLFQSLLPLLGIWNIPCGFTIHMASIYPFWLFLGYYLYAWGGRLPRGAYSAMALAGTAALAALTYVRLRWNVEALDRLFSYSSPLVILQAAGVAGWFFRCGGERFAPVKKVLANIDRHSFGIYLIHMAYVRLIYKHLHFVPYSLGLGGVPGILLVVLAAFAAAYVTDMVMKKLPVFRSIV